MTPDQAYDFLAPKLSDDQRKILDLIWMESQTFCAIQLTSVVDDVLSRFEVRGDKAGGCLLAPSLLYPRERRELVARIVDDLIEAVRKKWPT
jgi:hypothetical protein